MPTSPEAGTQNIVWFIENFADSARNAAGGKSPEQILETAAADVPIGAGGLLCLPYWTGAMTPYWDGHARGAYVGLSGLHGKAQAPVWYRNVKIRELK